MLKARIITALLLVLVLGAVLFAAPPLAAVVAFGIIAGVAAWEWAGLMGQEPPARWLFGLLTLFFCWQLYGVADRMFVPMFVLAAVFWALVVPLWLRGRWTFAGNDFAGYAVGLGVIVSTWAAMVTLQAESPWLLLAAMALVWVADIAAYFAGRAFGRRKLAPAISPGKTWEGVAGAVAGVLVYGAVLLAVTPLASRVSLPAGGMIAILGVLTALSIVGDLFESLLKRQSGIKDSSQLLPGHGGVLDRIDSLTSTLPVVALMVTLWRG